MGRLRLRYSRLWWWRNNTRYRLKFVLTGDCGHACDWAQPYGWVPENGCPVHDVEQKARLYFKVDTTMGLCLVEEEGTLWPIP